jgi:hypothetical protein
VLYVLLLFYLRVHYEFLFFTDETNTFTTTSTQYQHLPANQQLSQQFFKTILFYQYLVLVLKGLLVLFVALE